MLDGNEEGTPEVALSASRHGHPSSEAVGASGAVLSSSGFVHLAVLLFVNLERLPHLLLTYLNFNNTLSFLS